MNTRKEQRIIPNQHNTEHVSSNKLISEVVM